jgi:hypothetical protein
LDIFSPSKSAAGLGDLIFVMGEHEIDAAAMNVERIQVSIVAA